jgi:hypothetical protein
MQRVLLCLTFLFVGCFAEYEGPIEIKKEGLGERYYVLGERVRRREVRKMVCRYEDSRAEYRRYMRVKLAGVAVTLGLAAVLMPVSIKLSLSNSPAGAFVNLPLVAPALVSAAIQRPHYVRAIELHNSHFSSY